MGIESLKNKIKGIKSTEQEYLLDRGKISNLLQDRIIDERGMPIRINDENDMRQLPSKPFMSFDLIICCEINL